MRASPDQRVEDDLRRDLMARKGPLVAHLYSPFLWRHWATGWYTIAALNSRAIVLTDRRQYEDEWPWPTEFLIEWNFEGRPPTELADVDIYHLHNGWTATGLGLKLIEAFPDRRYVLSLVGTDVNKHARIEANSHKYHRLFDVADAALVPSVFLAKRVVGLGCPEHKISVIPPGVEPAVLLPKDPTDFSPAGTLKVCMLARMIELKGIDVAIEAVSLAAEDAEISLDVVGQGPEHDRLLAMADEVNARHRASVVRLHEDGETMPSHAYAMQVLRGSDCLVSCSRPLPDGSEEAMGVAMIEAQMIGVPVIAFWSGAAAEVVEHEQSGLLATFPGDDRGARGGYEEATAEGLASALVRLARARDRRVELGQAAAKRARRLFSTEVVGASYDRLYGEIAGP